MIVFLEILFLLLSISFLWFICRVSSAKLSRYAFTYLVVLTVGGLCFYVSSFIFSYLVTNVLLQFFLTILTVVALGLWLFFTFRSKLEEKVSVPAFFERHRFLVKSSLSIFFLSLSLFVYISVLALLSADKAMYSKIRNQGFISSFLIPNENIKNDQPWESIKSGIARSTGSRDLADNIRALNFILSLETEEYPRLIENNDSLKALITNPALKSIVEDEALMSAFLEEDLSMGNIYRLAEHKKVNALLNDEAFLKDARRIDLIQLEQEVIQLRSSLLKGISAVWSSSSIENSLHLDDCIRTGLWTKCTAESLIFPDGKYSLLKGEFSENASVRFHCKASIEPMLIYGDKTYKMKSHGDIFFLDLDIIREQEVILLFHFPKDKPRFCSIETFVKED